MNVEILLHLIMYHQFMFPNDNVNNLTVKLRRYYTIVM